VSPRAPVLEITALSKGYHGLRPLRIESLAIEPAERVALVGFDQPMAETFVNLVTGAALPERGRVTVLGRPTDSIRDSDDWLTVVDRIGIVSDRAVLVDQLSVVQNLSIPFTLAVDTPAADVVERAARLASEAGLPERRWPRPVADLDPLDRVRVRIARALAFDPAILLLEHATISVSTTDAATLAAEIAALAARRGCAVVAVTADDGFAAAVGGRVLKLDAATGHFVKRRGLLARWRRD
jgi:predicted ABC-type transport system involved in lysophospholipase L1 biosynthesis ATPase subunit